MFLFYEIVTGIYLVFKLGIRILIENIKYLEQTDTTFNLDGGRSLVLKQKWANVKRLEKIHNKQRKINWVVWMAFKLTSEE